MNRIPWLRIVPVVIALLAMLYQFVLAPSYTNPETGRSARLGLAPTEELALGTQAYGEVTGSARVVRDGAAAEQVQRVVRRLIAVTGAPPEGFAWEAAVLDDDQRNAFCLPGGKICVYTGILPVTQDDAGLAVVLGHEIAHATCHHGAERVLQQNLANTAMLGAQGSVLGMDRDQQRLVLGALGAGAQIGVLLPFSRAHESEADRVGLRYLARAGYDPRNAVDFWRRMAADAGESRQPEFLSTHPVHEQRIRQIEEWMPEALAEYRQPEK